MPESIFIVDLQVLLLTGILDPEASLLMCRVGPEVNLDDVGAGVNDVTSDVTGDARPVCPTLTTGNDVLNPVGGIEVTGKHAKIVVEYLE